MDKYAPWKWLVLIALTAWSLALVLPLKKKVKLGLDLKGGTSFTVQIDQKEIERQLHSEYKDLSDEQIKRRVPAAVERAQEQALEIIRNRVDALGVAEPLIYPEKNNRIVVQIPGLKDSDRNRAIKLIQSAAFLEFSMVHEDNDALVFTLFDKGMAPEGYKIVSLDVRNRTRQYYRRDRDSVPDDKIDKNFRERLKRFQAPSGYKFMLEEEIIDGQKLYIPYFVKQRYEMKGDRLTNAGVEYDSLSRPYVTLKFDSKGARKFTRITKDYAPGGARNPNPEGRRFMAIIMDGTLYSAPFIKTAIYGGEAVIEGNFSLPEAQNLSIVLRAGSLPAPVEIIESRTVDPSLGRDSIESGTRATIYACIAVVVFMVAYYFLGGVIANIGLILNMILLPLGMMITAGLMGLFAGQAAGAGKGMELPVLTLPGIAGIALTIGMAVDANVLIFERIREEQNQGKRLGPAVEAGYHKAFRTIVDANLTTVISAVILFIFGTGPVRGFGITLTAGIVVSMYTALMVTRMIFNAIVTHTSLLSLKMLNLIKGTRINFIGLRRIAGTISILVILGTWAFMIIRGMPDPSLILGTDFTGGAAVTFSCVQKPKVEDIRKTLKSAGIKDPHIQYQKELDKDTEYLQVRVPCDAAEKAKQVLGSRFSNAGFQVLSEDVVGPQIGKEMTLRAVKAIVFALIGMVIYISIRFRFAYAAGAIVALTHDVLVSTGLYCLLGRQINMTTIAALLAIVGFSVNDTIVIFDRIRENIKRDRTRSFVQICNLSINETLSRTIITTVTTFLAVILLFIFGGGAINDFALIFVIGIITGTYSTIYIATPVMILLRRSKKLEAAGAKKL